MIVADLCKILTDLYNFRDYKNSGKQRCRRILVIFLNCLNKYDTKLLKYKQVGNPTSTTSHLKRCETKDAQGSAHFFIYKWFLN
jgi:hypothetical protein